MGNMPEKGSFASLFSGKLVACEERMDKGGRGEEENIWGSSSGGRKVHQPINQLWLFTNFGECQEMIEENLLKKKKKKPKVKKT